MVGQHQNRCKGRPHVRKPFCDSGEEAHVPFLDLPEPSTADWSLTTWGREPVRIWSRSPKSSFWQVGSFQNFWGWICSIHSSRCWQLSVILDIPGLMVASSQALPLTSHDVLPSVPVSSLLVRIPVRLDWGPPDSSMTSSGLESPNSRWGHIHRFSEG